MRMFSFPILQVWTLSLTVLSLPTKSFQTALWISSLKTDTAHIPRASAKKIADKQTSLAELEQYTLTNGEPTAESGKQEYLEALVNQYIISAGREL